MSKDTILEKRQAAARKYQPDRIKLLLIAEAPPCDDDRYFYIESVTEYDWLFRYVCMGLLGNMPDRDEKAKVLIRLKEKGVFLMDVSEHPIPKDKRKRIDEPMIASLLERCRELKPEKIILIKTNVYEAAAEALRVAGFTVVNDKAIPFPASGQQKRFEIEFKKTLDRTGLRK